MGPTELRSENNRYNMENETADKLATDRNTRKKGRKEEEEK